MASCTARNKTEIRVNGLQRSGNHAIVHWIASQSRGTSAVLSDAQKGTDPFSTMSEFLEYQDGNVVRLVETWDLGGRPSAKPPPALIEYSEGQVSSSLKTWNRDYRLAAVSKLTLERELLIHTYEDEALDRWPAPDRVASDFGRSEAFLDILIMRDPLNFFASRLKRWNVLSGIRDRQRLVSLWKQHALESLGVTSHLGPGTIVVNFTRWAADIDYREYLARAVGVEFSDCGRTSVMPGFGSSFDGTSYKSNADEMRVNERWKAFARNEVFAEIMNDGELKELSDALFGPLEGWCSIAA